VRGERRLFVTSALARHCHRQPVGQITVVSTTILVCPPEIVFGVAPRVRTWHRVSAMMTQFVLVGMGKVMRQLVLTVVHSP
jgi:hypothetical protein